MELPPSEEGEPGISGLEQRSAAKSVAAHHRALRRSRNLCFKSGTVERSLSIRDFIPRCPLRFHQEVSSPVDSSLTAWSTQSSELSIQCHASSRVTKKCVVLVVTTRSLAVKRREKVNPISLSRLYYVVSVS
ncbi:hypothetical protein NDU88_001702 [Pleurodeles waltl]|uniref:Uncharacterized protein n=1 Tax=Pleurodeles waltl TaxID=8319 RepID=A0AAV7UTI3_PLEWA|nr:hypothetical protein NDU88_001702 [Pleurodeles waltl]